MNFPGASSTDLTNAKNLYAVLTGRISSITRDARIAEDGTTYNILGQSLQKGRMWQLGFFAQDGWRVNPALTLNLGLRYEIQLPFRSLNNSYSFADMDDIFGPTGPGSDLVVGSTVTGTGNLFKPGAAQGSPTMYTMLEANTKAYATDLNNLAPSVGAAWTTGADSGFLHTLLGAHGDSVIRAGYNISFQRGGMSDMTEVYGDNPGILIDATRSLTNGNLGTLPLLLTGSDLSSPSNVPSTRVYPMAVPSASSNVRAFDPNLKLPSAGTGTIGIQRKLSANTSIEARYIRTDSYSSWTLRNLAGALNYNEINISDAFLGEFRVAQANLMANIAAGKGNTFAYTGVAGTAPLPIYLAHLNGSSASTDSTKYTGSGWTNSTLVQALYALNPNPQTVASNLRSNATYFANSFKKPYVEREQNYSNGSASTGNVRHILVSNWLYDLPFGRGQKFGSSVNGVVDRIIGGWSIMGTGRFQSGRMVDFGNVRLIGFTTKDLQKMVSIRKTTDANNQFRTLVWNLPQDIIDNTVKAFSVNAQGYTLGTPTGRYFAPANSPSCLESVACGPPGVSPLVGVPASPRSA